MHSDQVPRILMQLTRDVGKMALLSTLKKSKEVLRVVYKTKCFEKSYTQLFMNVYFKKSSYLNEYFNGIICRVLSEQDCILV